jgi:hypothetical protein
MIFFFVNGAVIRGEGHQSKFVLKVQERFLYCVFDCFSLFHHSFVEIFSSFSEFVEDKDRVFHIDFSLFLQLLHSCDDFPCESSYFELFVLKDIQQDTE